MDIGRLPELGGRKILIVEDDAFVGEEMRYTVATAGGTPLGPAPSVDLALFLIDRTRPDAALLDLDLAGHAATPVADKLRSLFIPFVIVSGFPPRSVPRLLRDAPFVAKPFYPSELLAPLALAFQAGRTPTA